LWPHVLLACNVFCWTSPHPAGENKVLEKNFENVLHKYPELIEDGLKFSGRQVSVGGKFVDLLFIDRFGQKLVIELKKGSLSVSI
jgi:RecB family endonuclease NucS